MFKIIAQWIRIRQERRLRKKIVRWALLAGCRQMQTAKDAYEWIMNGTIARSQD